MSEKLTKRIQKEHLKTEEATINVATQIEFGKPIKLPNIKRKNICHASHNYHEGCRSIDTKISTSPENNYKHPKIQTFKEFEIKFKRKFSNNSQLHLLTIDEISLCKDQSKKILPKLAYFPMKGVAESTERFDKQDLMSKLVRINSQTSLDLSMGKGSMFKMGGIIGRGSYAIVRMCEGNDGKKYAAKVYQKNKLKSSERRINLDRQISIMKQISHPSIIAFKEALENEDSISIVMELFNNLSLAEYLKKHSKAMSQSSGRKEKKKISETLARPIMKQLFQAFLYLHNNNIVHRDIKLENILIGEKEQRIKLIDFGFAAQETEILTDYCGTPNFIAPEIIKKKGYKGKPADIWSLGILLYCLVSGNYPFKEISSNSDYKKAHKIHEQEFSIQLRQLLFNMLQNKPENRYKIEQVLESQWLKI